MEDIVVDLSFLCWALDCDARTIGTYARQDVAIRTARGRYKLGETVRNVVRRLREQAAGRMGRTDGVDAVKANADLKEAQRVFTELRTKQLAGELLSYNEIEAAWAEIATATKQLFLSVPSRARFDIPHLTGKDQKALERLVHDMLTEVAFQGSPRLPSQNE